ncbi:MAG: zinc ribbon domain-containing protein [Gammaproteobacteria bacterium]|nr:zinc ribbon domain-containing protein [Gammaproteobacteria bacterium]
MPIYEYKCPSCQNEFEEQMSLQEYSPLRVCPECNSPSPRLISAPQLRILKNEERIARERNERAIYEPLKVSRKHECSDKHCKHESEEKNKGAYQQISQGSRPWMLG